MIFLLRLKTDKMGKMANLFVGLKGNGFFPPRPRYLKSHPEVSYTQGIKHHLMIVFL